MSSELPFLVLSGLVAGGACVLAATILTLLWILRTPDALARVVGLELLAGLTTALFVLLGIWQNSTFYVEAALMVGLLGFIATIAYARLGRTEEGPES